MSDELRVYIYKPLLLCHTACIIHTSYIHVYFVWAVGTTGTQMVMS